MAKYLSLVKSIIRWFDKLILVQLPREQSTEADTLVKLASFEEAINQQIEVQYSPSHTEEEMNPINVNDSWMTPITKYLEEGTLPTDVVEARKLKVKSARFVLMQDILDKRGFSLPYLRCLNKPETKYVMREVHEGMQKNAISYTRAYDKCQRFGNLIHSPSETLTPITAP